MAETFKNKKSRNIGVTATEIGTYVVPAATVATVIGLSIANVTSSLIKASVTVYDGVNDYFLLKGADIVPGQAHAIIGGDQKVVLQVGESIRVYSDTATSIDAVMSILELS